MSNDVEQSVEQSSEGRHANRRPSVEARSARRSRGARMKAAALCAQLVIVAFVGIASAPGIAATVAPPPPNGNGGGGPGLPSRGASCPSGVGPAYTAQP